MSGYAEVIAVANAITRTAGDKRRDPNSRAAYVSWRQLDRLADALRRAGIDPQADNLGEAAVERILEAQQAIDARSSSS